MNVQETAEPRGRRMWPAVDGLLILAALGSSLWAWWAVPARSLADRPRLAIIEDQSRGADVTIRIDSTNCINVGQQQVDCAARLATIVAETPPRRVLLLIHPDAMWDTVAQILDQLEQAGVANVQMGMSGQGLE